MSHFFHQHPFFGMFMAFYAGIGFAGYESLKKECRSNGTTLTFLRWPRWSEITGWALLAGFVAVPMFVHYIGVPLYCVYKGCGSNISAIWGLEAIGTLGIYGVAFGMLESLGKWREGRRIGNGNATGDGYQ